MSSRKNIASMLAALVATSAPVFAQDAPEGGVTLTFGVTSRISANDNFSLDVPSPGTLYLWDNILDFRAENVSQNQRIALTFEGIMRASKAPNESNDISFDDPDYGFEYERNGAFANLEITADVSNDDLRFSDPLLNNDNLGEDSINTSSGNLEMKQAVIVYETGIDKPIGFRAELQHQKNMYTDVTDPDLNDSETNNAFFTANLRFSPVLQGRVTFDAWDYKSTEDGDPYQRTQEDVGFELDYKVSPIWTINSRIEYTDVEELDTGVRVDGERGLAGRLGATREFADGSFGIEAETALSVNGRRNTFKLTREINAKLYDLNASFGLTKGPMGGTEWVGGLSVVRDLKSGLFSALVNRSFSTSDAGSDIQTTWVDVAYRHLISNESSVVFGYQYAQVADTGFDDVDEKSTSEIRLAYNRALTRDWDMQIGVAHRTLDEATASEKAKSNEVFFQISREFTMRP
ncbi:hypothetical protein BFP76_10800 [Amylibacter kogurei]|uniref:TIGR03016 family PEP-CTERM system-associated outer membrane protein n=1 Tax=Paramylibacter kogurei TaxID=1889778 RepID=A0A2G5KB34_9RHOB|nr:hypothetical protein [Amylibacter kogurei]PIB26737.1 hypothetical protein BFP76_10800 [Amylibacter kogurei]